MGYLNENMLFNVQWQYRKKKQSRDEYERYVNNEVRPILRKLLEECKSEDILQLKAIAIRGWHALSFHVWVSPHTGAWPTSLGLSPAECST
jgi:cobalamin-dependent methionine synthase I